MAESLPPIIVYINPGEATAEDIAELYLALNELYKHFGGTGLKFSLERPANG